MWSHLGGILVLASVSAACMPSATTVSGTHAPARVCSGELIFAEEFDEFNLEIWQHENFMVGSNNGEFQYYINNRSSSFAHSGTLFICPSLLTDELEPVFPTSDNLKTEELTLEADFNPSDRCTERQWKNCEGQDNASNLVNAIKSLQSARIRTINSFSFRYGKVEVRAKMPAGDWLWPAIWLKPTFDSYGSWPSSGEIDMVESRGNRNLSINGFSIGTQEVGSTLHYGPYRGLNAWRKSHWLKRNSDGFNSDFHRYQLEWTPDFIRFSIDDMELGRVAPGDGGFWEHGGFNSNPNILNPWRYASKMAPFDQKFYIILNLAIGGTSGYFPDNCTNPDSKPWRNDSPKASADFWSARAAWLATWKLNVNNGQDASLQVDYVRVWAL